MIACWLRIIFDEVPASFVAPYEAPSYSAVRRGRTTFPRARRTGRSIWDGRDGASSARHHPDLRIFSAGEMKLGTDRTGFRAGVADHADVKGAVVGQHQGVTHDLT